MEKYYLKGKKSKTDNSWQFIVNRPLSLRSCKRQVYYLLSQPQCRGWVFRIECPDGFFKYYQHDDNVWKLINVLTKELKILDPVVQPWEIEKSSRRDEESEQFYK